MENGSVKNLKYIIFFFIFINIIELSSPRVHKKGKLIKVKRKTRKLTGEAPPELIILPPSSTSRKNLNYCIYYTPKDKEFPQMSIRYKHGISIIITAYKMEKYIKKTIDSIYNQTWFNKNDNWEILIGVDACNITLKYLHSIMKNYKNLRVFMMEENKGTYITTNTLMSIAKFDNLLRFDADDIMLPHLVELLMTNSESKNYDIISFKSKNFGKKTKTKKIFFAVGQIFMKHWVFDYFGGFMPWRCGADTEFRRRVQKFVKFGKVNKILFKRRIHDSNLTVQKKSKRHSVFRRWHRFYINNVSKKIKNINDAVIIKITNSYKEIFPLNNLNLL